MLSAKVQVAFGESPFTSPLSVSWTDISDYVSHVRWSRGRQRITNTFETGRATILLRNEDGRFHTAWGSGPYYPDVKPAVWVRIKVDYPEATSGDITVFTGHATRWRRRRTSLSTEEVVLEVHEAFRFLQRVPVSATLAAATTTVRVDDIESEAGISYVFQSVADPRNMAGKTVYRQTALSLLREAERSEGGVMYCIKDGRPAFYGFDESHNVYPSATLTLEDGKTPSGAGGHAYSEIEIDYSDEMIYNEVIATAEGGVPQTATDTASYNSYGRGALEIDVGVATDLQALDLANYWLNRFAEPYERVESVTVRYGTPTVVYEDILELEIQEMITLTQETPWGDSLSGSYRIERIEGEVFGGMGHIKFGVVDIAALDAWKLGSSELGTDTRLGI